MISREPIQVANHLLTDFLVGAMMMWWWWWWWKSGVGGDDDDSGGRGSDSRCSCCK